MVYYQKMRFIFDNTVLEIVNKLTYLEVVITSGGSFTETQNTLAGQARKARVLLEKYTVCIQVHNIKKQDFLAGGGVWFPALICTGNQLANVGGACFTWVEYHES